MEMTYDFLKDAIKKTFEKESTLNFSSKNKNAKELAKDGITIVKNFLNEKLCIQYYSEIKDLLNTYTSFDNGKIVFNDTMFINRGERFNSDYNMIDIFDIDKLIPSLYELKKDNFIKNIISEVSGLDLEIINLNIYYNNEVKPRILHVDNFMVPQYKAFIYLTDVNTLEDGPYMYVKGSHLNSEKKILSYLDNYKNKRYATDMREYAYIDAFPCIAKKGTLIITDQNGVHGAHPQGKGKERMLIMLNLSESKITPK